MFGNRMKHCLVFASLISPSKMILFEKKYQTFDTVFHHQMKHLEVRQKYSAARRISTLFSVFHLVMKHCISRLIYYIKLYNFSFLAFLCLGRLLFFSWICLSIFVLNVINRLSSGILQIRVLFYFQSFPQLNSFCAINAHDPIWKFAIQNSVTAELFQEKMSR